MVLDVPEEVGQEDEEGDGAADPEPARGEDAALAR